MRSGARAVRDELALRFEARGAGIAIAPLSLATPEVVAVPVADLGLSRAIGLAWRPGVPEESVAAVMDAIAASRQGARPRGRYREQSARPRAKRGDAGTRRTARYRPATP